MTSCPDCGHDAPANELFCYGRCESCFAAEAELVSPSTHGSFRRIASNQAPNVETRGTGGTGVDARLVEPAKYLEMAEANNA